MTEEPKTNRDQGRTRANWLPAPHYFHLNQCCDFINRAFGKFGCYLVGSSLQHRDYRDVDVRFIMDDKAFDEMFKGSGETCANAYWSLLCLTISLWLRQQTGLPVDFQIQKQSHANEKHKGIRSALGIFHEYPGELPSDLKEKSNVEVQAKPAEPSGDDPKVP